MPAEAISPSPQTPNLHLKGGNIRMIFTVRAYFSLSLPLSLHSFGPSFLSFGTLDRSRQITEQLPGSEKCLLSSPLPQSLSFRNECRLAFVHLFLSFLFFFFFSRTHRFIVSGAHLPFSKSPVPSSKPQCLLSEEILGNDD